MPNNQKNNDKAFEETKHITYENKDLISAYFYETQQRDFKNVMKQNFDVDVEVWHSKDCFSIQGTEADTEKAKSFLMQIADEALSGADISKAYLRTAAKNFKEQGKVNRREQKRRASNHAGHGKSGKSSDVSLTAGFQKRTNKITERDYKFEPRNDEQKELFEAFDTKRLIFAHGEAGSGKTHVSVAKAIDLYERGIVQKIIIARPAVEAGEKLGFIPGTKDDKIAPYMQPVYDELDSILGKQTRQRMIAEGTIEAVPLAFLRGRTLSDACVIIDEAQNTTISQLEMILTRAGEGTWIAVEGDMHQTDLDMDKTETGLAQGMHMFSDRDFAKVMFLEECVRSELAADCVETFKAFRDNAQDLLKAKHANDDQPENNQGPKSSPKSSVKRPGA